MTMFWPSCNCCARCEILTATSLALQSHWETLVESWDAATGVLSGDGATAITTLPASGAQYFRATITANEPEQVLDILLGCDEEGVPDIYARLTFGDASIENSCGSIELFEGGVALEDPQPVLGLVDGVSTRVTLFADAAFGRLFCEVRATNPLIYPQANATALLADDANGSLGLRLIDAQTGDVTIDVTIWEHIFTGSSTCRSSHICGTAIKSAMGFESTCVHTVGSLFYFGLNPVGVASVDSHAIISAIDRQQGYGIHAVGSADISDADETILEVYFDNAHHVARLTFSARTAGSCPLGGTTHHKELLLEVEKDGTVIASGTACVGFGGGSAQFNLAIAVAFCNGVLHVLAGSSVDVVIWATGSISVSVASTQVGDGSAHGASMNRGGISQFDVSRCLNCHYCEECEDTETEDRSWEVVVEAEPNTYDGTYILTSAFWESNPFPFEMDRLLLCQAIGSGGDLEWEMTFRRHNLHIGVPGVPPPGGNPFYVIEGISNNPLSECADLVGEVIDIDGLITGTATVTAL